MYFVVLKYFEILNTFVINSVYTFDVDSTKVFCLNTLVHFNYSVEKKFEVILLTRGRRLLNNSIFKSCKLLWN